MITELSSYTVGNVLTKKQSILGHFVTGKVCNKLFFYFLYCNDVPTITMCNLLDRCNVVEFDCRRLSLTLQQL